MEAERADIVEAGDSGSDLTMGAVFQQFMLIVCRHCQGSDGMVVARSAVAVSSPEKKGHTASSRSGAAERFLIVRNLSMSVS